NSNNVRSYRVNDWIGSLPASSNWVNEFKPLAKMHDLRSASKMILAGEGYGKNMFASFRRMYYNPNHGDLYSPIIHADGHAGKSYVTDHAVYGRPGYITAAGGGHTRSRYSFMHWGAYLHPGYKDDFK
ncbi:MAG: hypothetical protein KGZ25_16020, partial [Planctomycetes bacterium]|nr:hypothetical protein [Planctomycetota bacterium]